MIDYREDNKWTVYIHIVPKELSGYDYDKYYVGITSRNPKHTWGKNGVGYKNNTLFNRAINKYGWNSIIHEIVATNTTHNEACKLEKSLITKLNSNDRAHGYNITSGGQGMCGFKLSNETKEKISKANRGREISQETIEKIRQGNIGKKLSELTLKRRSEYFKNTPPKDISITKTVYQFTKDGIFTQKYYSIKSASEATGVSSQKISYASNHNNCSAGGFLWIKEDNIIQENGTYTIKNFIYNKSHTSAGDKEIFQFNIDTNEFMAKYPTLAEASRVTGESVDLIRDDARYKRTNVSSKKRFRWRYKEDVKESDKNTGSFFIV